MLSEPFKERLQNEKKLEELIEDERKNQVNDSIFRETFLEKTSTIIYAGIGILLKGVYSAIIPLGILYGLYYCSEEQTQKREEIKIEIEREQLYKDIEKLQRQIFLREIYDAVINYKDLVKIPEYREGIDNLVNEYRPKFENINPEEHEKLWEEFIAEIKKIDERYE